MNEGISAPFIRYPIGTSLLMAGILFVGLVAYPLLPVAPLPQVDFPTIQVTANLPGGSPETMASSVAQPLERQLAQIPGIAQMTSTSYLGTSAVTIQFDLNRSIDGAANDQMLNSKDWNDVIVAYRNGGPLRIRDIGQAVTGPEDAKQAAWANGKRGVFLVVFKQPGANVIETVDKIKATLPRLVAAIPPAIKIELISDRTTTIRAAVEDVQFTLVLTIALVVMVIFIFLRSFWATVIPTVTVPLALLGACALMWVFGYTLDNLSLMALTIAVGFVVDDAIVMLENITRYIEEGEKPLAAAFKGASEIGFTIVSISISLVAVLIPLLLMGGIIGRLFREFAVTLAMTIFVSMVVSLTLTPMMASRFLRAHR